MYKSACRHHLKSVAYGYIRYRTVCIIITSVLLNLFSILLMESHPKMDCGRSVDFFSCSGVQIPVRQARYKNPLSLDILFQGKKKHNNNIISSSFFR